MIPASHAPAWVREAVKDWEAARIAPRLLYYIDGELFIREIESTEWGWGDGPAMDLKATLAGRLPSQYQGAPIQIVSDIGGWTQEMFVSKKMRFTHPHDDWRTEIQATTAGGYASEWKLEADVELDTWPPHVVARYAASRLPYDQSDVRIYPFESPNLVRTKPDENDPEDLSFAEGDVIQSIFDVVEEEVMCIYYDSPRGLRFEPDPGFGGGSTIEWDFRRGSREIIAWPAPEEVSPDEQFAYVVVLDKYEDGTDRIRAKWPVDQRGRRFPAHPGQIKYMSWSDTSAGNELRAWTYAKMEAERLARGVHSGKASITYNPFMFPGRVVQFEEPYRDNAGTWQRVWLVVLKDDVRHNDRAGRVSTDFSYEATKYFEELVDVPVMHTFGLNVSYLASQAVEVEPRHYGWAGYDGDFWLDPEKAAWLGTDEIGFYIAFGPMDQGGGGSYAGTDDIGDFVIANVEFRNWGQEDVTFDQLNIPYSELF